MIEVRLKLFLTSLIYVVLFSLKSKNNSSSILFLNIMTQEKFMLAYITRLL